MDLERQLAHLDELEHRIGSQPETLDPDKRKQRIMERIAQGESTQDALLDLSLLLSFDQAPAIAERLRDLERRTLGNVGQFLLHISEHSDERSHMRPRATYRLSRIQYSGLDIDLKAQTCRFHVSAQVYGAHSQKPVINPGPAPVILNDATLSLFPSKHGTSDQHTFLIGDEEVAVWVREDTGLRMPLLMHLDLALFRRIGHGGTAFDGLYRDLEARTLSQLLDLKRRREALWQAIERPGTTSLYQKRPLVLVTELREVRRALDALIVDLGHWGLRRRPNIADFLAHLHDPYRS